MHKRGHLGRNLHCADMATQPRGSISRACKGTWQYHLGRHRPAWRRRVCAKWIGPKRIVDPFFGIVRGGVPGLVGGARR